MKPKKFQGAFLFFIILTIVCIGANYAGFVFLKRANLKIANADVARSVSERKSAELFGREENDVRSQILKLNSFVANADQSIGLIEDIEDFGRSNNIKLEINSVTIDPPVDPEIKTLTETLRLRFEASGSWQKITEMIFYMEHLPYRATLENVALAQTSSVVDGELSDNQQNLPEWRFRGELLVLKEKI